VTIAGNGAASFFGDLGPATLAGTRYPTGVAVDRKSQLYVADFFANRVRIVNLTSGIIDSIAGKNGDAFSGDGGPAINASLWNPCGGVFDVDGNLYFAARRNHRIRLIESGSGIIRTVAGSKVNGVEVDGSYNGDD
jgi:hypothetical protein